MLPKAVCFAALLVPGITAAQEATRPDTTPFRRGQWAAQFGTGFSFSSLGLLKFRSPTSAWLLDAVVTGHHQETSLDSSIAVDSRATVTLRLGRRSYPHVRGDVVAFHTLGILGALNHNQATSRFGPSGRANSWSAGVFGDVGASYLVSSNLSLGAIAGLSLVYGRSTTRSALGPGPRTWSIDGGTAVSFAATIYF